MTWLLCYDIENDTLRQKLAKYLEKKGWERLQKSVYAQGMEAKEFNRQYKKLNDHFAAKMGSSDKIYAWGLSDKQFATGHVTGAAYDAKWIQKDYVVLYIGEEELLK